MYSNRSPPTVPAGMELPYISIPARCGIAPSTGISLLRRYSSMLGSSCGVNITDSARGITLRAHFWEFATNTTKLYGLESRLGIYAHSIEMLLDDALGLNSIAGKSMRVCCRV